MNPARLPSSLSELEPDATLEHTGFRLRSSLKLYAQSNNWAPIRGGDRVRFCIDSASGAIGFRVVGEKKHESGLIVSESASGAVAVNNVKIRPAIAGALRQEPTETWSLAAPATDGFWRFEPADRVLGRVRVAVSDIDTLARSAGFAICGRPAAREYIGRSVTVLATHGAMTAMRRGVAVAEFHLIVPFQTVEAVSGWLRAMNRCDADSATATDALLSCEQP